MMNFTSIYIYSVYPTRLYVRESPPPHSSPMTGILPHSAQPPHTVCPPYSLCTSAGYTYIPCTQFVLTYLWANSTSNPQHPGYILVQPAFTNLVRSDDHSTHFHIADVYIFHYSIMSIKGWVKSLFWYFFAISWFDRIQTLIFLSLLHIIIRKRKKE